LIASNGSVVPLFINQIKDNEPITITNPNMARFMMGINEAIDLVELALEKGHHGDILIKAGKLCKIGDLAKAVCNYLQSDENYPIKIIGARPGEKLYENLLTTEEAQFAKFADGYFCIPLSKEFNSTPYNFEKVEYMSISEIIEMIKTANLMEGVN
jgi:UDP-glucose 4-epimerase